MVGQRTLNAQIGVRIPVPQPENWCSLAKVDNSSLFDRDENNAEQGAKGDASERG
jgi:hypothetical protein